MEDLKPIYGTENKRAKRGSLTEEDRKVRRLAQAARSRAKRKAKGLNYLSPKAPPTAESIRAGRRTCRTCGEKVHPTSYYYCANHHINGADKIND